MKQLLLLLTIALFCCAGPLKAQQSPDRLYEQGVSMISVGHGIGNIWKTFLKQTISYPGITYKISSVGPLTCIYEYGISHRISGGIALGYSEITGKYSGYGDSFTDKLTIFSALARANYHLGKSPKFDYYFGGGLGYVRSKYNNSGSNSQRDVPGELGYSGQVGAKYSFVRGFGVYAEVGYVGGSFVQLGLTGIF